jgi:SSS family solute:Na+ symporter
MTSQQILLIGVGLYLVAMLVIGAAAGKRVSSTKDFLIAGGKLTFSFSTFALLAAWYGAATVMGAAGAAYKSGFLGVIADPFGSSMTLILAGLFYVRLLRRAGYQTSVDFYEARYGRATGILAALSMVVVYIGWCGSQVVALGFILNFLTGVDKVHATVIAAVVVMVYTSMGGMLSAAWNDFLHMVVLLAGLSIVGAVFAATTDFFPALGRLPASHFHVWPHDASFKDWVWYIEAWCALGLGNMPGQDLLQRSFSAENEKVAPDEAYLAGLLYFSFSMIPVLIGMAGAVMLPDLAEPEVVVLELMKRALSPALLALLVGALVSGITSAASSAVLAGSSLAGKNLLRALKPGASDASVLLANRIAVPLVGAVALLVALRFQTIYQLMVGSFSVMLALLFASFHAGLYWKRANTTGAIASIVAGAVTYAIGPRLVEGEPWDLWAFLTSAAVLVAVSLLTARRDPPMTLRDADGRVLEYRDRLGVLRSQA